MLLKTRLQLNLICFFQLLLGWFANPIFGSTNYATSANTDQSSFKLTDFSSNELRDIKGLYAALIYYLMLNIQYIKMV